MSYLSSIFFVALYFAAAIFNSGNNFLEPKTRLPVGTEHQGTDNPMSLTTNSLALPAASLHTLSPDFPNSLISKISYTSTGGKAGNYESLDITTDSVVYVQGHRGVEKTIKEKTLKSFWSTLTKSINLKDFDKIKSNPGHALYDGIDITISIQKGTAKYSIVNGNEDSVHYIKIKPFTDLLQNKLAEIRKKIVWEK